MIEVPRTNKPHFEEPPLSWRPTVANGKPSAMFNCPNGHMGSLDKWDISEDGTVNPSVDCSPNGCDFHDFIKLLDWNPNLA